MEATGDSTEEIYNAVMGLVLERENRADQKQMKV